MAAPAVRADPLTRVDAIKARGFLTCGLHADFPGLAVIDAADRAVGFEADLCRAVAAAVLGADRVKFVAVQTAAEFLLSPDTDVVFRGLSWTFTRELTSGMGFGPVYFHDGQTFLVRSQSGARGAGDLAGTTVCVAAATHFASALDEYARSGAARLVALPTADRAGAYAAFLAGRCAAVTDDATELFAFAAGHEPDRFTILPERISDEPLAGVVRRGDEDLLTVLRWTVFAVIAAEELGLTAASVDDAARARSPAAAAFLALPASAVLGLEVGWTRAVIRAVGNYGEIYRRNFARPGGADLPRGRNELSTHGGLLYAPPLH